MLTVTIANLKGGTAKSTTAAYLGHVWHGQGHAVLLADADPPGSLLRWSELGEWPMPVVGLPVRTLHQRLPAIAADYDLVVVDTPPLDEQAGIVYSALRAAEVVVVPVSPTTIELDRLSPIMTAVEEVAPLRAVPPVVCVLLTRVVARAASTPAAREVLTDAGHRVLEATVPRLERYAQSFGGPVKLGDDDPYTAVAEEIGTLLLSETEVSR